MNLELLEVQPWWNTPEFMEREGVYSELVDGYIVPSNPWFDAALNSPRAGIEFVRFQAELEAIARYVGLLDDTINRTLVDEREAFERQDYLAGISPEWSGEAEMVASEELLENEDLLPRFAYGSVLVLCFTILEKLLDELVAAAEHQTGHRIKTFDRQRGEPEIAHAQRFIESALGTRVEVDADTTAELHRLRVLRNRFVHGLAEPRRTESASADPLGSALALLNRNTIEQALQTLGGLAFALS
jgi:hypothetical protein